MINEKMLSGYELVSKGATKLEASLPEIGLKDTLPNGSWLEQKQIQAALEARKHLIEVERIEKSGSLSHAIWREELMLAEVTQQVGGYWQYLGHVRDKELYLKPEEALYLMEINCLHLIHNDVKVSLQQAYTLLLREKILLLQYKVYATLSRVGYRVFRHEESCKNRSNEENNHVKSVIEQVESSVTLDRDKSATEINVEYTEENSENVSIVDTSNIDISNSESQIKPKNISSLKKIQKLKNRKLKPCNNEELHKNFEIIPEMLNKTVVTIHAPDAKYLPKHVNLRKTVYYLDVQKIRSKIPAPINTPSVSPNEEVNGNHIRRLRTESYRPTNFASNQNNFQHNYGYFQNFQNRFNFYRPLYRPMFTINFMDLLFQRRFIPGFAQPPQFFPRPNQFRHPFLNDNHRNKRTRGETRNHHLQGIQRLASRLKQLFLNGNCDPQNVQALHRLIHTYNMRYKTTLRLSDTFDIYFDEVVDTIQLDDDEPVSKRRRQDNDTNFEQNLNSVKNFASKLKELETDGNSSARHRRLFSKLLKTFNESYNTEYYVTNNYEIENKRLITLDSDSSLSDCVIEEPDVPIGKKLKNPFNILKKLSEKQGDPNEPSTSNQINHVITEKAYSKTLLDNFTVEWLPGVNDFGRAEILDRNKDKEIDIRQEEFLDDFIKIQIHKSNNWLNLKKSYYSSIKEAVAEFQDSMNFKINSLVKPKDCLDMASVLKKLSIIKTEKRVKEDCNLAVDFDVYNRDVQNFRKSNRPTPHFRVVCLSETTNMPPAVEIASLHSKYKDNVPILFAIVGESFSYIQVNPTDLPVYLPNT